MAQKFTGKRRILCDIKGTHRDSGQRLYDPKVNTSDSTVFTISGQ